VLGFHLVGLHIPLDLKLQPFAGLADVVLALGGHHLDPVLGINPVEMPHERAVRAHVAGDIRGGSWVGGGIVRDQHRSGQRGVSNAAVGGGSSSSSRAVHRHS